MKNDIYNIIKGGWVTEKSSFVTEINNSVTFKVTKGANKNEIKEAVEKLFNVTVLNVNTLNVTGKKKGKGGKIIGKLPDWKKAIVQLKEGDKIELVKGV